MNLYWGELHLHTAESFDATLFGNTLSIEDACRFAKGNPLNTAGGETMQLSYGRAWRQATVKALLLKQALLPLPTATTLTPVI